MNHAPSHRDGVPEDFIGDAELFKRMNATGGEREVNGSAPDDITLARIGPALVKLDCMSATSQTGSEDAAGEPATDENELRSHAKEELTGLTGLFRFTQI
jgi:hypothetical protein